MPLNVRIDGGLAVLSNFGRLLNDPRHFDAGRDVRALLDEGHRAFVIELAGVRDLGETALGLFTTLTRLVRNHGGEVVLTRVAPRALTFLEEMRMDAYWDVFDDLDGAHSFYEKRAG